MKKFKKFKYRFLSQLGPGLVTGAADDDPSGIATYSQSGALFGTSQLWTVFLTTPFMAAIQLISARIGRVTGKGIVANAKGCYPPSLVFLLISLLLTANTFNIAADIAAMGEALQLVLGGNSQFYAVFIGFLCLGLQIFIPYHRYAKILKWLTFVLFLYIATAFTVEIDWAEALTHAVIPSFALTQDFWLMIVAILGTTISPYLFFWQAAQEIEESNRRRKPLTLMTPSPVYARKELRRIRLDTWLGMIFSNTVAFFIILTTAVTLHSHGITNIETAAQAAEALRPLAGELTFFLFSLGIIGTGLLAVPVLAGSAAYSVAEFFKWQSSLEDSPREAFGFYMIIASATLIGIGLGFLNISPIRMLIWSAVLNGVAAPPIMFLMMALGSKKSVMGQHILPLRLRIGGWGATLLMGAAVVAMGYSFVR